MLISLLLGAILIGLLTGSGPYVDAKGMVGCSNVTYMLSKGISMMLILVIVTSVFCVARGIRLSDICKPTRLGLASISVVISITSVWLTLYLVKRYGPGYVVPVYVVVASLLCFLLDTLLPKKTNRMTIRPRDMGCLVGIGLLLYLLYQGRPNHIEDPTAKLF